MRLVARRLIARIDGSRWCIEQEGAHRPPAGRLLHPGLHLSAFCDLSVKNSPRENVRPDECAEMFVPIEFASRRCDTNSPRSSLKISEREFVDRIPRTGQDSQHRTHANKLRDHLGVQRSYSIWVDKSLAQPPGQRRHRRRANKTRNGHTKCRDRHESTQFSRKNVEPKP